LIQLQDSALAHSKCPLLAPRKSTQASLGAALAAAFRYRGHQCTLQLRRKRINTSSSSPDYRCSTIAPRTRVAEAYAMVFLVELGFAQQTDVARAFAVSRSTPLDDRWRGMAR